MTEISVDQAVQLAAGHQRAGRLADAESVCRQILAVAPRHADALNLLGMIAHQCGQHHAAADCLERSLLAHPNNPSAVYNLGRVRQALGEWDKARVCHERAVSLQPAFAEAHNNLGLVYQHLRRLDDAQKCYERSIALRPELPQVHNNLGTLLLNADRPAEARRCFERALALSPEFAEARINLGNVLLHDYQLDEARRCYEQALRLRADLPELHNNLGNVLHDLGRHEESIASYRRAMAMSPGTTWFHSNLIHALHFDPATTPARLREEGRRWDAQHAAPLRRPANVSPGAPAADRRLRVGYVSADFRAHAVSGFLVPLFSAHDHARVEIHAFASVARADAVTARLRAGCDVWHEVGALTDEALAERIRTADIDVLVDLSLHTSGNRLPVFARQPAPVQVSWLGAPGCTGLGTIRYHLTDARLEPPADGETEPGHEQPMRLPDAWCCFDPMEDPDTLPVGELPALRHGGRLTFGSLNNPAKHNAPTLRLWARVLAAVPGSRLLLRCVPGEMSRWALGILRAGGVEAGRVELTWREPTRADYLRRYQAMDVALDPLPYNGMTTSCEALWMGVPLLTLPGEMPGSRAGLSLLSVLGLDGELVAADEEAFVRRAVEMAGDLPRLSAWRAGLRARMQGSALMDAPRFARHVEGAYFEMWRRWCGEKGTS